MAALSRNKKVMIRMKRFPAALLAAAVVAMPLAGYAASKPPGLPALPAPPYPNKPMHVRLLVEVNDKGQVVRVEHGTLSGDRSFDTMALGNAMQMWIRTPNGSAITGLYNVTYDYDPKTHQVRRVPTLVKAGGNWANKPGAATAIVQDARRQVQRLEARLKAEEAKEREESAKHLPDINAAVRRAMTTPSPHPGAKA